MTGSKCVLGVLFLASLFCATTVLGRPAPSIYEAEDSTFDPNSRLDYRPYGNWLSDHVVSPNQQDLSSGDWKYGWVSFKPPVGEWVVGVRVRAGYMSGPPIWPTFFAPYWDGYRAYVGQVNDPCNQITLVADSNTLEHASSWAADNQIWLFPSSPIEFDGNTPFVVATDWVYGMVDAFGIFAEPNFCRDPGTVYLKEDLCKNCRVDFPDYAVVAANYGKCSNPQDGACTQYWIPKRIEAEGPSTRLQGGAFRDVRVGASGVNAEVVFLGAEKEVWVYPSVPQNNYRLGVRVRAGYGTAEEISSGATSMVATYNIYCQGWGSFVPDWSTFVYHNETDNYVWLYPTSPYLSVSPYDIIKVNSSWSFGFVDAIALESAQNVFYGACTSLGANRFVGDLNTDCYVNLTDVLQLVQAWMHCTYPDDATCDVYWK